MEHWCGDEEMIYQWKKSVCGFRRAVAGGFVRIPVAHGRGTLLCAP